LSNFCFGVVSSYGNWCLPSGVSFS
jgi:hypothetical protein